MKIAVGYDGSDHAKAAIDDLCRSGLPDRSQALVISVGDTLLPIPTSGVAADPSLSHRVSATLAQVQAQATQALEHARALAEEGVQRTRDRFPRWEVRAEALVGSPAAALMQAARDWGADLLVVAAGGRSAVSRVLLGSVSKQVASEASQSVLVSRHVFERGDTPIRIVLGVDQSDAAGAAIQAVKQRAWPTGTEIRILAVDETVQATGTAKLAATAATWVNQSNTAHVAELTDLLQHTAMALRTAGLEVSTDIVKGSAHQVLCDEAHKWVADSIVVGSSSTRSTLGHFREASVAIKLVTTAPCSVEIVRSEGR